MIRIVYLDDNKKGWLWMIPVDDTKLSVGVVVDNETLKKYDKQSASPWQSDFYHSEIAKNLTASEILKEANCEMKIYVNGDYSYNCTQKFSSNYAMIGDSGRFIDPIFSSGVFIAMKSAQIIAKVIPEYLKNGEMGLLENAFKTIDSGYGTVETLIDLYYNPQHLHFAQMEEIKLKDDLEYDDFKQSYTLLHYLLAGDFFEKGEIYKQFFNELKSSKKFSRWKNLVKWESEDSGVFHQSGENCGENLHEL